MITQTSQVRKLPAACLVLGTCFLLFMAFSCKPRRQTAGNGTKYKYFSQMPLDCIKAGEYSNTDTSDGFLNVYFRLGFVSLNENTTQINKDITVKLNNESDFIMFNDSIGIKLFRICSYEYGKKIEQFRWDLIYKQAQCYNIIHSESYRKVAVKSVTIPANNLNKTSVNSGGNTYAIEYTYAFIP